MPATYPCDRIIGSPRRKARGRFAHIRSRRRQKSRTARATTRGLAPVAEPGRSRVVGDADLDDDLARGPQLDDYLGGEEGAARFNSKALERLAPEKSARAVDVGDLAAASVRSSRR
jgi:hypothetical protein